MGKINLKYLIATNEELRFHFLMGFATYYFVLYALIFENKNKIINLLTLKK